MKDSESIKTRIAKDLLSEVQKLCQLTGHSNVEFIDQCLRGCIESIHSEGRYVEVPPIVIMVRAKLKKGILTASQFAEIDKDVQEYKEKKRLATKAAKAA